MSGVSLTLSEKLGGHLLCPTEHPSGAPFPRGENQAPRCGEGQLAWVTWESPPFAEGGYWQSSCLEVVGRPGQNGAGGLSHPSRSW